jgi:outer membrane protein assembly factor BamB
MRRTFLLVLLVLPLGLSARADDWPQWLGPQRDGVWRETGILEKFPKDGPKVRWRTPIGMGYSGPAVAAGRVYITDRVLPEGTQNPRSGFTNAVIRGKERVLCLDEKDGKVVWKHEYDCTYEIAYPAGPRTTPAVDGDRVYTLGAMGDLYCLKTDNGEVVWSKNLHKEYNAPYQQWGFSSSPLVDGDRLICVAGGRGSVAVALDKMTGKEIWKALDDPSAGYCPPVIFDVGGKRQLIIWTGDAVNSLDPETGKPYWKERFVSRAALAIPTPRLDGDRLFVTAFYNGSLMLKLAKDKPAATVLWKVQGRSERPDQTDALHSIMSTPYLKDGYIYGVCSYGELRCLKADTGERVWSTLAATTNTNKPIRWANAFLVPQGDRTFLFNELGDLIIAKLSPKGYEEISRAHLLEPTNTMATSANSGRANLVIWSHPAFANKCCYARNDKEIICVSLAAE